MDLDRLRYFRLIADLGSMKEAAKTLKLSPAALTKAMKTLESELGLRLLAHSGRGIVVTDEGRLVAERAEKLLKYVGEFKDVLKTQVTEEHIVRIGSFETFGTYFLTPLFGTFLDGAVEMHSLAPGALEQAIVEAKVDLGVTYVPVPYAELDHLKAGSVDMGVFGRRSAFGGTSLEELPFVAPARPLNGSPNRVQGLDGWPEVKVPRKVKYRVDLLEGALELCRSGLAVAYLPKFVVAMHNERVREKHQLEPLAQPSGAEAQPVYVVRRKSYTEDELVRKLSRAIRLTCKGP